MSTRIIRGSSASRGRKASNRSAGRRTRTADMRDVQGSLHRFGRWFVLGVFAVIILAIATAFSVPRMIGNALGEAVGRSGFAMARVEIKGANHVPRLQIYNVVWDQPSVAMPLVDLGGVRERLLRFGWVKEARVSRRFPDTLVIDLVERQPIAIWQHEQQLVLIDRDGVVLEDVRLDAMPDLPLIIGPDANRHASELGRLIDAASTLKPLLAGATWVGGRRWDLRFQSGELLALPEGEEAAKKALVQFVRMDKAAQLLGRGLARFDMRIPGKFIVRVSREPGSVVPTIDPAIGTSDVPDPANTI